MNDELLRPDDVQQILRIGRSKVYEMIARGELPVIRIGRVVRLPRKELERWIEDRTSGWRPTEAACLASGVGRSAARGLEPIG
jgi:excisionase family DNA binding protein